MKFKYPVSISTVAFATLLLGPALSGTAQSILLTAENFVLLGGTAVSVGGAGPDVFSNGDVGAAASITGFPPAVIVNGTQMTGGVIVGQALNDLITARNGLSALVSPPANNLTGVNGGDLATQILTPGVYKFDVAASISLNGVLTLDAQGKNNVVWVFNIGTSLTTGANVQVQFINLGTNGGSDNGLFWNAGTAFTFGANNVIAGNYLAGTDITFGTTIPGSGSGSGRALALAGVSFDGSATMDVLGNGGDLAGGLAFNGGMVSSSGYVLLSANGSYAQGVSSVVLSPGAIYNTVGVTIDGASSDTLGNNATLTVFQTIATLTGANTYTGGTFIDAGQLTTGSANLPENGAVTFLDSNATGVMSELVFDQSVDGTFGGAIAGNGSVTKNNTGILTLTGVNTYDGGTTVNGGTLVANSSSLPSYLVTLVNNSSLVLDQAVDGEFSAVIAGAGSFTKQNVGVLTLSGANTYDGGTSVNGGTLLLSGAGTLGATTGALAVDTGTLDLGGTSQTVGAVTLGGDGMINNGTLTGTAYTSTGGTVGAVLAGTGSFTNTSGTTTLTGANTYTGGTVVNGGILVASAEALPANQAVTLADNTTLVLNQASDGTYAGMITSTSASTIEKQGAGSLTLANSTSSAIDLQAGSLILANEVGATTVASGAFLRGNGTVNGDLFNAGTVSPGLSPGTIVVVGNYTQDPAGTLVIEIASPVLFDQLLVGGTASLAGTVQIDTLGGYDPVGEDFTVITATGGVNGTFAVQTGSAAVEALVTYNTNDVVISFAQTAFATFAGTPNQTAIANTAQLSPALTTALNGVPLASQMPAAINALSPQGYQVWSDIAFAHSASLGDRLRRQPGAIEGHDDYYFEASRSRGSFSGDQDVGSSRYTSDSGLVGGNHFVSENLTLGGFFEYTETDSGMGSAGSSTNVKTKMPGIRAAWKKDAWFANAIAAYGFDDYESTRAINFPGTSATAKSETTGRQWVMDVSGGRRFQAGPVSLSPFAGLQASGWKADGFTETGAGALNATVGSQRARSLRTQLGLEAAVAFDIGSIQLRPHARGAWIHELSNDSRSIDGSIDGVSYSVVTRDPQRDSARLSAGLDVVLSPTVSLYADYSVQTGDTTRVIGEWRGGLAVRF